MKTGFPAIVYTATLLFIGTALAQENCASDGANMNFAACESDEMKKIDLKSASADELARKIIYETCKTEAKAAAEVAVCQNAPNMTKEEALKYFTMMLSTAIGMKRAE